MSKGDAKYFSGASNKGELFELREELNSPKEDRKKEAVKKVIAAMTVGKDVSVLFTEVLNCIQTKSLELKKLVYLYLMNYAKTHPDRVVLAVNTFQKDASDPNPLIRALAIRTMGCIRVEDVAEHLCLPLQETLKDSDPYVRKTAAICVAKLYDLNPGLVEQQGFIDTLNELLADANPMVVANAVAALSEIDDMCGGEQAVFTITKANLNKLQAALNQCTEWGQVFILSALAKYTPRNEAQAEQLCERIAPRLNHANSAVVLGAVRVIIMYMDHIGKADTKAALCRKMGPPLVTLLSKEPEVQYVALRNINLIVQKLPSVLASMIKVFFCKYNDRIYVKMEKLEIMVMLTTEANVDQVLLEFKEYATEVDVEFVRRAVRAIGRCAIKIESAAKRCVGVLLDLIKTKVNYVVQEAIVVIKDIFRKYPNKYEGIITNLCESLETLDEPEAKAAMIWIIGEYAERIDNADELLETFLDTFAEEPPQVQLQLLTAVVKLFLKRPKDTQELVKVVLDLATEKSDNPDLRDRGFVYWRLLSTDPEAAKAVVLAEKPLISDSSSRYEQPLLDDLIAHIGTLASVYHKPPETFVSKMKGRRRTTARAPVAADDDDDESDEEEDVEASDEEQEEEATSSKKSKKDKKSKKEKRKSKAASKGGDALGLDLLDLGGGDLGGGGGDLPSYLHIQDLVAESANKGFSVRGAFDRQSGAPCLRLSIKNNSVAAGLGGLAIQFNKNTFRLAPAQTDLNVTVAVGQTQTAVVALTTGGPAPDAGTPMTPNVQFALKSGASDVVYGTVQCPLYVFFTEDGKLDRKPYLEQWKTISDANERNQVLPCFTSDADALSKRLEKNRIFEVARRNNDAGEKLIYCSCKMQQGQVLLFEVALTDSRQSNVSLKTPAIELDKLALHAISLLMK